MSLTSYLAAPPRDFIGLLRSRRRKLANFPFGARTFLLSLALPPPTSIPLRTPDSSSSFPAATRNALRPTLHSQPISDSLKRGPWRAPRLS